MRSLWGIRVEYCKVWIKQLLVFGCWIMGSLLFSSGFSAPVLAEKAAAKQSDKATSNAQSAWVKLCDQVSFRSGDRVEEKAVCLTHHERLDVSSGRILVSAAVRTIEGSEDQKLIVMVPAGLALQPGVQVKIDDEPTVYRLKYTVCHAAGCSAELTVTPDLMSALQTGKKILVAAMNVSGKPVGFPVPLAGFAKTFKGPPMASAAYEKARKDMLALLKKRKEQSQKK